MNAARPSAIWIGTLAAVVVIIQMAMTPVGLAVVAGIAAALFFYVRWLVTD